MIQRLITNAGQCMQRPLSDLGVMLMHFIELVTSVQYELKRMSLQVKLLTNTHLFITRAVIIQLRWQFFMYITGDLSRYFKKVYCAYAVHGRYSSLLIGKNIDHQKIFQSYILQDQKVAQVIEKSFKCCVTRVKVSVDGIQMESFWSTLAFRRQAKVHGMSV